jgi:hypothetical protein
MNIEGGGRNWLHGAISVRGAAESPGSIWIALQSSEAPYVSLTPFLVHNVGKYVSLRGTAPPTQSARKGVSGGMNGVNGLAVSTKGLLASRYRRERQCPGN